jgi:hypothetical protein
MIFIKNNNFSQGTKIIKNTENVNGVRLKIPMFPGLTPLIGCRFII